MSDTKIHNARHGTLPALNNRKTKTSGCTAKQIHFTHNSTPTLVKQTPPVYCAFSSFPTMTMVSLLQAANKCHSCTFRLASSTSLAVLLNYDRGMNVHNIWMRKTAKVPNPREREMGLFSSTVKPQFTSKLRKFICVGVNGHDKSEWLNCRCYNHTNATNKVFHEIRTVVFQQLDLPELIFFFF
jgi:hypothetical protein